ncbi:recombinase family protein [Apilactobacillus kunkeei]|uniref:recombinase family protein n=1 Tax=Apilactobacillus kunkeei TaxID=148814 RepID=UPI003C7CF1F6
MYTDKYTGTSTDRVGFQKLLDALVVTKLDRLARNTREALNVLNELQDRNIKTNFLYLGTINQRKKIPPADCRGDFLSHDVSLS